LNQDTFPGTIAGSGGVLACRWPRARRGWLVVTWWYNIAFTFAQV